MRALQSLAVVAGLLLSRLALAWGADGHHTVGALAERLIAGSHAASEVKALLGNLGLADAGVWADCAKGVDPDKDFTYTVPGRYPECQLFETPDREADMADFVRRNLTGCHPKPGEEQCHRQYHYADVDIQQRRYRSGLVGTRESDIVAAIVAAVQVLRGEAAAPPFDFKSRREALLVLTHYLGDLHQPLHVGAIYLDARGKPVHPDRSGFDPATDTVGGNVLTVDGDNFHSLWDTVPQLMKPQHVNDAWLMRARALPKTPGTIDTWPRRWATSTLGQAREAYRGVSFAALANRHWAIALPPGYSARLSTIQEMQLTAAGAHLAALLEAIWP